MPSLSPKIWLIPQKSIPDCMAVLLLPFVTEKTDSITFSVIGGSTCGERFLDTSSCSICLWRSIKELMAKLARVRKPAEIVTTTMVLTNSGFDDNRFHKIWQKGKSGIAQRIQPTIG